MPVIGRRRAVEAQPPGLSQSRLGLNPARWALALAVLATAIVLLVDMSGSAPRLADTNHVAPIGFYGVFRGGTTVCQPGVDVPAGSGGVKVVFWTYQTPLPSVTATLVGPTHRILTRGLLPGGGSRGGEVIVPLRESTRALSGTLCLKVGGSRRFELEGTLTGVGAGSATVGRRAQNFQVSVRVMRRGSESWWQLLPTLTRRFGYGKWSVLGGWTFIAGAVVLAMIWIWATRLLWRELR